MAKVADVRLSWSKSPSADVKRVRLSVNIDGTESTADLGPDVNEFMVEVKAGGTVTYKVVTIGNDDLEATSADYTFTLGSLEVPEPAFDLFHKVVAVRDV